MFKFGIFKKDQLKNGPEGFFAKRKFIALDLYNSLDDWPRAQRDKIQERMLGRFSTQNGSLKRTHTLRFSEFDKTTLSIVLGNFSVDQRIRVHDVGVSDGRSSCELYDLLDGPYHDGLRFVASDYAPFYYILRKPNSFRRLILDSQNNILQIITPPFVFIEVRPESAKLYPLNHLIRRLVSKFYARPLLKQFLERNSEIEHSRFDLLSSECRALLKERGNFSFETYDVLSGPTNHFDVIRAMNVLNLSYFTDGQLMIAVQNIFDSMGDGGLFVTGSNLDQGTVVNGAIYKKAGSGFERLFVSGTGSQIDRLILNVGIKSDRERIALLQDAG